MKKIVYLLGMVIVIGFTACEKSVVELCDKESLTLKNQQKNLGDDTYPFILEEGDLPFRYAVYESDINVVFNYVMNVLSTENGLGYCEISYLIEDSIICYGYVSEIDVFYEPIFEGEGSVVTGWIIRDTTTSDSIDVIMEWAHQQINRGLVVFVSYDERRNEYFAIAKQWQDD